VETTPPSHSRGRQLAQTSAEMIVNMVPVVGGTIAVALTVALNHTLNKRRERWFTELAEVVDELRDRVPLCWAIVCQAPLSAQQRHR
jgi:uncharacterized protein (DUF697 family)